MVLKAVLFDFNGVIINDEPIHERLIYEVLLEENLRPTTNIYRQFCLGRSDRAALQDLFKRQERPLNEVTLQRLMARKKELYHQALVELDPLPLFPGLRELLDRLNALQLSLAVVSGAVRSEIEWVLERTELRSLFSVIVSGDEIQSSKPNPEGYLLAIARLNELNPEIRLTSGECLAIEDTPAGIEAAKQAGISVVGVANTFPFRMMHRQANWVVDYVNDLDLDYINWYFNRRDVA
jgi:beta-phosphoglucomutase